ncbi:hypothetical protein [Actinobacillus vicugnae]|uniref:hypothetical protein n=1 Tax=Actinobacillus vicugnae TaxID=2573093 RepID=UPI003CC7D452
MHSFSGGNRRIGRLWQSLILSKWNPIFERILIETVIYQYHILNLSSASVRRYLVKFVELNLLQAQGERKNRTYFIE